MNERAKSETALVNVLSADDQTDLREVWAEELSLLGNQTQSAGDGS